MMSNSKRLSVELKMQKAKAFYAEVEVLMQNKFYSTAINRLYYACFHATQALLLTKDIIPKTHSGVITMLNKHFVIECDFDKEKSSFFSRIMKERSEVDYGDFIVYDEELVNALILPSHEYIEYVESYIHKFYNEHQ